MTWRRVRPRGKLLHAWKERGCGKGREGWRGVQVHLYCDEEQLQQLWFHACFKWGHTSLSISTSTSQHPLCWHSLLHLTSVTLHALLSLHPNPYPSTLVHPSLPWDLAIPATQLINKQFNQYWISVIKWPSSRGKRVIPPLSAYSFALPLYVTTCQYSPVNFHH